MIPRGMPENKKRPGRQDSSDRPRRTTRSANKPLQPPKGLRRSAETPPEAAQLRRTSSKHRQHRAKAVASANRRGSASAPVSILMVASEAHPYAKTGGLAEVAAALPDALGRLGHRVTLVLPRYRGIDISGSQSQIDDGSSRSSRAARRRSTRARSVPASLSCSSTCRNCSIERAASTTSTASTTPTTDGASPCSAAPRSSTRDCEGSGPRSFTRTTGRPGSCRSTRRCTSRRTRSSAACRRSSPSTTSRFRESFRRRSCPGLGLGPELLDIQALEFWGQISYLKGGINFSERLTTVSPTYAREILTPEFGFGFDGVLRRRADALTGILNGIDVERWNPEKDDFIGTTYSRNDLSGKATARRVLLETAGLRDSRSAGRSSA